MLALAAILGVISGFGAIAFHGMFALLRNISFLGHFSFEINMDNYLSPSIWGAGIILVPVLGAMLVVWLTRNFGAEVEGSGVPEVLYAIYYRRGLIRPVVAMGRILATAVSVGTGASVGRDGPMVQMGAALSSAIGQLVYMPAQQRDVLIAAGAGAGLAATFNAPVGALTFTVELMLVSINPRNFAIVAVSTLAGAYIGRLYFGAVAAIYISPFEIFRPEAISLHQFAMFIPLGICIGLVSYCLIQGVYIFNKYWGKLFKNPYARHMIAMLIVGCILYAFISYTGRYYVEGVAHAPISDMVNNVLSDPKFLVLLFVAKFAVSVLALGSGASGGAFAPALFLGASGGAIVGNLLDSLFPGMEIEPSIFAIGGMAGSIGSITGAAITGVVFVFERTRDYHAILPGILTVAMANVTRSFLLAQTIYTYKAALKGFNLPLALMSEFISIRRARDAITKSFQVISIDNLNTQTLDTKAKYILLKQQDSIRGFIPREWLALNDLQHLTRHIDTHIAWLHKDTSWLLALQTFRRYHARLVIIASQTENPQEHDIIGVIGKDEALKATQMTASLYTE